MNNKFYLLGILIPLLFTVSCSGITESQVDTRETTLTTEPTSSSEDSPLSAYELYIKYHPYYAGDEETWINDLAEGNLNKKVDVIFSSHLTEETFIVSVEFRNPLEELPTIKSVDNYDFIGWFNSNGIKASKGTVITESVTFNAEFEYKGEYATFSCEKFTLNDPIQTCYLYVDDYRGQRNTYCLFDRDKLNEENYDIWEPEKIKVRMGENVTVNTTFLGEDAPNCGVRIYEDNGKDEMPSTSFTVTENKVYTISYFLGHEFAHFVIESEFLDKYDSKFVKGQNYDLRLYVGGENKYLTDDALKHTTWSIDCEDGVKASISSKNDTSLSFPQVLATLTIDENSSLGNLTVKCQIYNQETSITVTVVDPVKTFNFICDEYIPKIRRVVAYDYYGNYNEFNQVNDSIDVIANNFYYLDVYFEPFYGRKLTKMLINGQEQRFQSYEPSSYNPNEYISISIKSFSSVITISFFSSEFELRSYWLYWTANDLETTNFAPSDKADASTLYIENNAFNRIRYIPIASSGGDYNFPKYGVIFPFEPVCNNPNISVSYLVRHGRMVIKLDTTNFVPSKDGEDIKIILNSECYMDGRRDSIHVKFLPSQESRCGLYTCESNPNISLQLNLPTNECGEYVDSVLNLGSTTFNFTFKDKVDDYEFDDSYILIVSFTEQNSGYVIGIQFDEQDIYVGFAYFSFRGSAETSEIINVLGTLEIDERLWEDVGYPFNFVDTELFTRTNS